MSLPDRYAEGETRRLHSVDSNEAIEACPARQWGILGFHRPTSIPCSLVKGHRGNHRYILEWT